MDLILAKLLVNNDLVNVSIYFKTIGVVHHDLIGSTNNYEYFKLLLQYICNKYPNHNYYTFMIVAIPNSQGICLIHIYNTSQINSDGVPQYSSGIFIPLESSFDYERFGTNNYNYYDFGFSSQE